MEHLRGATLIIPPHSDTLQSVSSFIDLGLIVTCTQHGRSPTLGESERYKQSSCSSNAGTHLGQKVHKACETRKFLVCGIALPARLN